MEGGYEGVTSSLEKMLMMPEMIVLPRPARGYVAKPDHILLA
jgi:hypothetical protein